MFDTLPYVSISNIASFSICSFFNRLCAALTVPNNGKTIEIRQVPNQTAFLSQLLGFQSVISTAQVSAKSWLGEQICGFSCRLMINLLYFRFIDNQVLPYKNGSTSTRSTETNCKQYSKGLNNRSYCSVLSHFLWVAQMRFTTLLDKSAYRHLTH